MTRPANGKDLAARVASSNLFFLTIVASLDGSVFLLAASGKLSTPTGAILAGLTVVAGVGSWIAARAEYGNRTLDRVDYALLSLKAAIVTATTIAAAALGILVAGTGRTFVVLPIGGGVVFALLALEVSGLPVPRVRRVPLPFFALGLFVIAEVTAQWIL